MEPLDDVREVLNRNRHRDPRRQLEMLEVALAKPPAPPPAPAEEPVSVRKSRRGDA